MTLIFKFLTVSLVIVLLFFSLLTSPYRDELDLEIKQLNGNGVLVIRLLSLVILLINGLYLLFIKPRNTIIQAFFFLASFVALYNLIKTFFL
jgi:hypothetical protein